MGNGTVDYVYAQLESGSRTLRVRVVFDNADHALRPGMFGQLTLRRTDVEPTLTVPREAVIRGADMDRVVVAVAEERYQARAVELGRVGEERIEILAGLEPGDTVVTSGQFLIDSESSVDADLARMGAAEVDADEGCVWLTGVLRGRSGEDAITLEHDPVPEWGRPAMTMSLPLGAGVSAGGLAVGDGVRACVVEHADGSLVVERLERGEEAGT